MIWHSTYYSPTHTAVKSYPQEKVDAHPNELILIRMKLHGPANVATVSALPLCWVGQTKFSALKHPPTVTIKYRPAKFFAYDKYGDRI